MTEIRHHFEHLQSAMKLKKEADTVIEEEREWLKEHLGEGLVSDHVAHKVIQRQSVSYKSVFEEVCNALLSTTKRYRAYEILNSATKRNYAHTFIDVSTSEGVAHFLREEEREEIA